MPQSLVIALQAEAMEGSKPIADLMRKAKIVAVKLKAAEFETWIDKEVSGYIQEIVPDYRIVPVQLKFFNPMHGRWYPIIGPGSGGHTKAIGESIGRLQATLQSAVDGSDITMSAPRSLVERVWDEMPAKMDVQYHLARASITGIIETVRNTVLDWALRLEQGGVLGHGLSFTSEETKAAQSVINNFHGPVGAFAQNESHIGSVVQTIAPAVDVAEVSKLIRAAILEWPEAIRKQAAGAEAAITAEAESASPDEGLVKAAVQKIGKLALTVTGEVGTQFLLAYMKSRGWIA